MDGEKSNNKILLINPKVRWINSPAYDRKWPPLSLAYTASILEKKGFKVEIVDANTKNLTAEKLIQKSKFSDKVFLTTSPLDKWQCPEPDIQSFLDLTQKIRKVNPNIYLIGAHGTVKPHEFLKLTKVKAIIRGEPELTTLEICQDKQMENIEGITFKKNKKTVSNPDRPLLDLDKLPLPSFHLLPMEEYLYEILGNNFTLFEASRGCPFSCIYCFKSMYGNRYRKKSYKKLVSEIEYAIENFGIKNAYFIDLEFCFNKKLVEKLCDFLIRKNYDFHWTCETKFDSINYELLKKMKKAGCELIHFGVESGSPRILKKIDKNTSIGKIKKGMKKVKKAGIKTACFFMFGLPTENKKEMKMTIKLAKQLDPNYASFHIAIPYPGTKFYNIIKDEINKNDLFPTCFRDKEDLEKIRRQAYKSFYLRPQYFKRRLKQGEIRLLLKQIRLFLRFISRG